MVVGKLSILAYGSSTLANNMHDPRFFDYRNGGFANNILDLSFGWFKKLDDEQKLAYNQAIMHALSYSDNGEVVRWYKNNASGSVVPAMSWRSNRGHCRRLYVQAIAHGVEKTFRATACFDEFTEKWTWFNDK